MKKILLSFGTRPEAIKMAPIFNELKKFQSIDVKLLVTAQHRQMLDQVLDLFEINPDFDLDIMKDSQTLSDITTSILTKINPVLDSYKPDLLLVHGDTSTTFASALAAYYKKVAIGHIEAGLRTGDIYSPWPEEANRKLTGALTTLHFAPTNTAKNNLLREGYSSNIFVTGNTVIDALIWAKERILNSQSIQARMLEKFSFIQTNKKFILVTGHRRENFGNGFINICNALVRISKEYPEINIVYPVHLNPNVQKPVNNILFGHKNIFLIPPQEYLPFVYLMMHSHLILTDSGGIQEEAPSLGKPVLVMRETSERPEAIDAGTARLVGSNSEEIFKNTQSILEDENIYQSMSSAKNPYGDGSASKLIAKHIKEFLYPI